MFKGECSKCKRDLGIPSWKEDKKFYICEGCNTFSYVEIDKENKTFKAMTVEEFLIKMENSY